MKKYTMHLVWLIFVFLNIYFKNGLVRIKLCFYVTAKLIDIDPKEKMISCTETHLENPMIILIKTTFSHMNSSILFPTVFLNQMNTSKFFRNSWLIDLIESNTESKTMNSWQRIWFLDERLKQNSIVSSNMISKIIYQWIFWKRTFKTRSKIRKYDW